MKSYVSHYILTTEEVITTILKVMSSMTIVILTTEKVNTTILNLSHYKLKWSDH